jgi:hypothetical protein
VLAPRWMERAPDAVEELAVAPPPAFEIPDDIVERWRDGEDVADEPEAAALARVWEEWLVDERLEDRRGTRSDLVQQLWEGTRYAHTVTPWQVPPPEPGDD